MGIKEIYYSMEESYYKFLDKIDAKIPIYKIIDPIDKIVPSFILILVAAILAVIVLASFLIPPINPADSQLLIVVKDDANQPLYNVKIDISGEKFNQRDARTDESGRLEFESVPYGEVLEISAKKNGYVAEIKNIQVRNAPETVQIVLKKEEQPIEPITIQFLAPSGYKLEGEQVNVHLECTNGQVQPEQRDFVVDSGELTVT